jgi:hypothetical protein
MPVGRDRETVDCLMQPHRGVRATFLALAGIALFAYWVIFDPTNDAKSSQSEWRFVIGFSAALLILAVAILLYGDMVGGRWVRRLSIGAATGLVISGVANVFEDGFSIDWVFFVFVLGTATTLISLIGTTVAITATNQGRQRLLALVPGCTVIAVIGFVAIGGPLMLITWLTAAALSLKLPDPQLTPVA